MPSGVISTISPFSMYWTLARLAQEGGDGAGEEGLALAATDDERALLARADERLGLVERHRDEGVVALELGVGGAHGLQQRAGREVVGDQVGDDLGVGLAGEDRAHVGQALAHREVVLDDAVDHDVDAVGGVEVRVGVLLVDPPVGGPARVADAGGGRAGRGGDAAGLVVDARRDGVAQVLEVADRADRVDRVAGDHRDAGRVVAAVLQAGEALEQQVLDGTLAYVADDAAHGRVPFSLRDTTGPLGAAPGRGESR